MDKQITHGDDSMLQRVSLFLALMCVTGLIFAGEPDDTNPRWKGIDFSGEEVDFPAVLDNKPTVLIFWATWCPYCKAFMPYLGEIQKDYGADKIKIIAIDVFEDGEGDPAAYVAALGFPVIAVADGDEIAKAYAVRFTPGLIVVNGQGNVVWKRASTELPAGKTVAELWDEQVREQLDRLL